MSGGTSSGNSRRSHYLIETNRQVTKSAKKGELRREYNKLVRDRISGCCGQVETFALYQHLSQQWECLKGESNSIAAKGV